MIKLIFIIFIFVNFLFAQNSDEFVTRKKLLLDMKKYILKEELIANAYQEYILNNYKIPLFEDLYSEDYLGLKEQFINGVNSEIFNNFSLDRVKLSYGLKDALKNDAKIKALYESDTFRKKTFYKNDKIYLYLDDEFAKHIYHLISKQGNGSLSIENCSDVTQTRYCKKDNHIYIYSDDNETNLLFWYSIDKFKTGPFMITDNSSLYLNEEFKYIPKGVILYDIYGLKHIKTSNGIKSLK